MTLSDFQAFITAIGESNIIAIVFDGGRSMSFTETPYSNTRNLDTTLKCIIGVEADCNNREYLVYSPIETIHTIQVARAPHQVSQYNSGSVRS